MTGKELIQALRCCSTPLSRCEDCPIPEDYECFDTIKATAADRLEALLAENERLWDSARRLWAGMPRYCGDLPGFAMHADEPPSTEGVE